VWFAWPQEQESEQPPIHTLVAEMSEFHALRVERNRFDDYVIEPVDDKDLAAARKELTIVSEMIDRGGILVLRGIKAQSALVGEALDRGFHVYSSIGDTVVMRKWAQEGEDKMFKGPFTAASASALVVDAQGRVLFVRQAYARPLPGKWGLPAGFLDPGETLAECAAREVLEETGIEAHVASLLLIREAPRQDSPYWSTGLQFVFLMRPKDYSEDALKPRIQVEEISEAKWMQPDEFTDSGFEEQAWDSWPAVARAAALAGVIRPPGLDASSSDGAGIGIAAGIPSSMGPTTLYLPAVVDTSLGAPRRLTDISLAQPRYAAAEAKQALAEQDGKREEEAVSDPMTRAVGGRAKPLNGVLGILPAGGRHMQPTAAAMKAPPRWMSATTSAVIAGTRDAQVLARGGRSVAAAGASVAGRMLGLVAVAGAGLAVGFGLGKQRRSPQ
jgi:ADP-ribose pyrophosphatase YjhB (NUDIX family)